MLPSVSLLHFIVQLQSANRCQPSDSLALWSDCFSHGPSSTGLSAALVTPGRGILSWEGAWRTEGSSKSPLPSAFTPVVSSSEPSLHTKNLRESRLTPTTTLLPTSTSREDWGQRAKRPSTEERKRTPRRPPIPLTNQSALHVKHLVHAGEAKQLRLP